MIKVYYAHPISYYKTELEDQDVQTLERLGFFVINPADYDYDGDMSKYLNLVRSCRAVYFRPLHDGKITSGVAMEIDAAITAGIPVVELFTQAAFKSRVLSRNETRARMGLPPVSNRPAIKKSVIDDIFGDANSQDFP